MSYNIPLDPSGDVDFTGTMTANAFVGDGSGLINLPLPVSTIDTGSDYTWTGDNTFDGSVAVTGDTSLNIGSFVQNVIGVEGDTDRLFIENSVSTLNAGTPSESTNVWTRMVETGAETSKDNAWRLGLKDSWGMYFNKAGFIIQEGSAFKIGAYDAGASGLGFVTTAFDLGLDFLRWPKVWATNASFNGTFDIESGGSQRLYNLGTDGDTDTEYLEIEGDTSIGYYKIQPKYTGTGRTNQTLRMLAANGSHISLYSAGSFVYTHAGIQHLICNSSGVSITDLDVSGTLTVDQIQNSLGSEGIKFDATYGYLTNSNGAVNVLRWGSGGFESYQVFMPRYDNLTDFGATSKRWLKGYFYNGSFSGNLNTEVGGSQRVYNLGAEGDVDTEYLETYYDSANTRFYIRPSATGAGVVQKTYLGDDRTFWQTDPATNTLLARCNNSNRLYLTATDARVFTDFTPNVDGVNACGTSVRRWSNVASVDGNFSGTVTTNTIESDSAAGNMFIKSSSTSPIYIGHNGALTFSFYNTTFQPQNDDSVQLGTITKRWSQGHFANVNSVNGNFSGTVTANSFVGDGSQLTNLPAGGSVDTGADFTWTGEHVFEEGLKFNNLYSEIGGSFKLYNLGGVGDTDTEYLDISATANEFFISPKTTGAGSGRDLFVTGSYGSTRAHLEFQNNGNLKIAYGSNANILVGSTYVKLRANVDPNVDNTYTLGTSSIKWSTGYFYTLDAQTGVKANSWEGRGFANMFIQNPDDFPIYVKHNNNNSYIISSTELSPMSNNSKNCGSTTNRWANVNTVDLNASGTITLADVLNQTTDPAVAGQLWNDSGAIKISAG